MALTKDEKRSVARKFIAPKIRTRKIKPCEYPRYNLVVNAAARFRINIFNNIPSSTCMDLETTPKIFHCCVENRFIRTGRLEGI